MNPARLSEKELYWKDHYHWLLDQGYRLRPRYHPDWTPSWQSEDGGTGRGKRFNDCEDAWNRRVSPTMNDAFRVSNDQHVVLKRVSKSESPEEVKIMKYFSEGDIASDPMNHCPPLLDVLAPADDEEHEIVVIPLLRIYDDPPFDTVGEVLAFLREILEGFAFLHKHRVAHRDIKGDNILMDAVALGITDFNFSRNRMNRDGTEPIKVKYRRTERWPRYYIIDFGFSSQYSPEEMPPSVPPLRASDPTLPELAVSGHLFNPFPSDVYYIGNWIRMEMVEGNPLNKLRPGFKTLEFLQPLIKEMTVREPAERITVSDAIAKFDSIVAGLPATKLRSPLEENSWRSTILISKAFSHWRRRLLYIMQRKPPMPRTPASSTSSTSLDKIEKPDTTKAFEESAAPMPEPELEAASLESESTPIQRATEPGPTEEARDEDAASVLSGGETIFMTPPTTPAANIAIFAQRPHSPASIPLPASPTFQSS